MFIRGVLSGSRYGGNLHLGLILRGQITLLFSESLRNRRNPVVVGWGGFNCLGLIPQMRNLVLPRHFCHRNRFTSRKFRRLFV